MRAKNTNHHTQHQEDLLASLRELKPHKRDLLNSTLKKISIDDLKLQEYYVSQNTATTHTFKSGFMNKARIFSSALATIALLVFAGTFGYQKIAQDNSVATNTVDADGSISNLATSITQDLSTESTLNQEMFSQSSEAVNAVTNQAQSIGEISNENNF